MSFAIGDKITIGEVSSGDFKFNFDPETLTYRSRTSEKFYSYV
jgi:hypothetical protein